MSTKIYNGRLLAGPIGRIYPMLLAAKPEAEAIARSLETSWMANRVAEMIDDAAVKGETASTPLLTAWSELQDRRRTIRREGSRDVAVDFEFDLWLFPQSRGTLAIMNTEQTALREWLDGLPFVSEYAYFDNIDRPEHLTSRQWADRRRAWDRALPGAGVPTDRCLTFAMVAGSHSWFTNAAETVTRIPSVESRLGRQVSRHLRERHHAAMLAEEIAANPEYKPEGFDLVMRAIDAARDDVEGIARVTAKLAPLIREITAADIEGTEWERNNGA